ncbi:MAG: non-canonical purine NTP pyrophosphatase [Candidatus Sungiibacteriota bacterium]|uniref:Non-canonical purine NTP pyrophosphatase n=1 Tax=Candidatus Sungiibacteriota bacterium TaxID=2750080 RepID=A0A7T5RJF0_9BACT|nr:MAG: non-canonical purine NTP pyrophosphatase [Candidatus Sungbacteria bacterium]
MRIVVATTNPAKFKEAKEVLQGEDLEILSLGDFPNINPVEESGDTFEENAVLKAKGYFLQTQISCIADDGGLEVEYLGGAPGVHSKRWLGYEATDWELAQAILKKLEGVSWEQRKARLGGFISFFDGKNLLTREDWIDGYIMDELKEEICPGFPYRPLLYIPQFRKTYAELTEEEHNKVNFRRKNLRALKSKILELL